MNNSPLSQKLLIVPFFKKRRPFLFNWKIKTPIQNRNYELWIKITNIGERVATGIFIKHVMMKDAEQRSIQHDITQEKEYLIPNINPEQIIEMKIESDFSTCLKGLSWLEINFFNKEGDEIVEGYQENSSKAIKCSTINRWVNIIQVKGAFEHQQQTTNAILLFLTMLTTIQIVPLILKAWHEIQKLI